MPVDFPFSSLPTGAHPTRAIPVRTVQCRNHGDVYVLDDKLDELYLQGSTQWDGLFHVGDVHHGFYNGIPYDEELAFNGHRGISAFAEFGIVSRSVLVDVPRHFAELGLPWSSVGSHELSAGDLQRLLVRQRSVLQKGDVLLVRTGWIDDFRKAASPDERHRLFADRSYSGLSGDARMWEFLWDSQVAAVASDAVTVERFPLTPGEPNLHLAIARLGLVLGEMFDLDELANVARREGRHHFFFVSAPLNVQGAVGAPANALAIL